jgi:hypothetical protein
MLTPSNHSVSMRDYLFELKSQAELDSWTAELAKVQEKGDSMVYILSLNMFLWNSQVTVRSR